MRPIALLCSGPSLPITWGAAAYDTFETVIAVNRAAELGCDWWYAQDRETFEAHAAAASVRTGLCTWGHIWESYQNGAYPLRAGLRWANSAELPDGGFYYRCLSMLGAMAFAVQLGAERVEIFGADWSGLADFAGGTLPCPESRSDKRWAEERRMFEQLCAAFPRVTFNRVIRGDAA